MGAGAVQKIDAHFPLAADLDGRRLRLLHPVPPRGAEHRRDRVADLRRLAGLELERVDLDRVLGRRIVVEHDPRLAVERPLPQLEPIDRILRAVPRNAQPRHKVHTLRPDRLARRTRQPPDPVGDGGEVVMPFLLFGGAVALGEPVFDRGQDTDDVFLRHLHRPA